VKLFGGTRYPGDVAKRVPPGQRLVKGWPVLHVGPIPKFNEEEWDLRVDGLVEDPLTLSYTDLKALPNAALTADMHCVTGWTTLDNVWEGVLFRTVAERARPLPEARWVTAHCDYGYTSDLSLEAMMEEDVLLAWAHNGEPLTPEHGFPLRLVVPARYGWKSAKWLRGLEFAAENRRGYWEERGYHVHADPWPEERYSYQEGPGAEQQP
jgi:DMSO/TMAO reductase YedYZ molybdopterin-dependent catalytic subunit